MPRKDGKPRSLPAPLGLDPKPYMGRVTGVRTDAATFERLGLPRNNPSFALNPRPGYSQNHEDYE